MVCKLGKRDLLRRRKPDRIQARSLSHGFIIVACAQEKFFARPIRDGKPIGVNPIGCSLPQLNSQFDPSRLPVVVRADHVPMPFTFRVGVHESPKGCFGKDNEKKKITKMGVIWGCFPSFDLKSGADERT